MKRANHVRIFAVLLSLVLLVSAMLPFSSLAAANTDVQKVADSVVQVLIVHINPITGAKDPVSTGTGFVVSKNVVITADHVTNIERMDLTEIEVKNRAAALGYDSENALEMEIFRSNLTLMVSISRDVRVDARILNSSFEADWAILQVDQGIANKQPLYLRKTSDVQRTEDCHVLGFPVVSQWVQNVQYFTSDDVTIGSGTVVKMDTGANMWSGATYDYVQTNAVMISGNSGGPLVDDDGCVLGVCQGYWKERDSGDGYYYASSIDQIIPVLEAYGIPLNICTGFPHGGPAPTNPGPVDPDPTNPVPDDPTVDYTRLNSLLKSAEGFAEDEYTAESYKALEEAVEAAEKALRSDSQAEVDDAVSDLRKAIDKLEIAESDNNMLIIIIAAAVLLVIIIVVIIIIATSGKKNKAAAAPAPAAAPVGYAPQPTAARPVPPAPPVRPAAPVQPARPVMDTNPMPAGNGETTLLSSAGETTILSAPVAGGTLIRGRNNERIVVNAAEFVMGRERSQTNYCISDNTSVGRTHAKIVVRGGKSYLVDMKSRNGTYLNGARLTAMQENELKAGDVIKLADEEFTFQG